jgi:hypothetical protein
MATALPSFKFKGTKFLDIFREYITQVADG